MDDLDPRRIQPQRASKGTRCAQQKTARRSRGYSSDMVARSPNGAVLILLPWQPLSEIATIPTTPQIAIKTSARRPMPFMEYSLSSSRKPYSQLMMEGKASNTLGPATPDPLSPGTSFSRPRSKSRSTRQMPLQRARRRPLMMRSTSLRMRCKESR